MWLIHIFNVTCLGVHTWHVPHSFEWVTWLTRTSLLHMSEKRDSFTWETNETHLYVWHMWLIHICDKYDSFIFVMWLVYTTGLYVDTWRVSHSYVTHLYVCQMWLIHMCVKCDSFIFVMWLVYIFTCDMWLMHTWLIYMRVKCDSFMRDMCDSIMCVTWLVYTSTRGIWPIHTWLICMCVKCDSFISVTCVTHSYVSYDWFICPHVTCDSFINDLFVCVSNATHS